MDFSKTTLETWKQVIPAENYEIREQDREIVIDRTVKLFFGGLDDREMINKFNSAEYAFFALDQAEETERSEVSVLQATRRLKYRNKRPPYKALYTANPAECWLKEDFITMAKPGHVYVRALPSDNPYLPENYIKTLEAAFSYDPLLLKAYKEGDWDVLQRENILITPKMMERLKESQPLYHTIRRVVACDPSTGGDECVIYVMENGAIKAYNFLPRSVAEDTMKIAGQMAVMMNIHAVPVGVVDSIGVGQGVADRLRELLTGTDKKVYEIVSSMRADDPVRFENKRAEMWWEAAVMVRNAEVPYPDDPELRKQLTAVTYEMASSEKIKITEKAEIKKRIGRSPDRADAYVYGLYGQRFCPDILQMDRMARVREQRVSGRELVDVHMGDDL